MRRLLVAVLLGLMPCLAYAQSTQVPVAETPLQAPSAPVQQAQSATPGTQQPSASAQPASPPKPWLPQGGAALQALDKVNAQTSTLTVQAGQTVTYGSLSITVERCVIRPPDMPQDAAASLRITDSHAEQPGFQGWMLKSDPSLSMLQHPIYDIRVIGCVP